MNSEQVKSALSQAFVDYNDYVDYHQTDAFEFEIEHVKFIIDPTNSGKAVVSTRFNLNTMSREQFLAYAAIGGCGRFSGCVIDDTKFETAFNTLFQDVIEHVLGDEYDSEVVESYSEFEPEEL